MMKAKHLLVDLRADMPPEIFAPVRERGKALDIDTRVADLLSG
jgi:hypothetical protein